MAQSRKVRHYVTKKQMRDAVKEYLTSNGEELLGSVLDQKHLGKLAQGVFYTVGSGPNVPASVVDALAKHFLQFDIEVEERTDDD